MEEQNLILTTVAMTASHFFFSVFLFILCSHVFVYGYMLAEAGTFVELGGQLEEVCSLLPLCAFQRWNPVICMVADVFIHRAISLAPIWALLMAS